MKKGQSVLEYILIITAIVVVIVGGGAEVIRKTVNKTLADSAKSINVSSSYCRGYIII